MKVALPSLRESSPGLREHLCQCTLNYHGLMRLVPDLAQMQGQSAEAWFPWLKPYLWLQVLRCSPYTTTARLWVGKWFDWLPATQLTIRIYHDVRVAEVIHQGRRRDPDRHHQDRDYLQQTNQFLGQWLCWLEAHGKVRCMAPPAVSRALPQPSAPTS